jgi:glycosyltransferase involved in cell wall biosynthesis
MTEPTARLTVVIASTDSTDLKECLNSLEDQTKEEKVEIIVAASCGDDSLQASIAEHPKVRLIRCPPNSTLPHLLGTAIARSTGDIIAVTDSACTLDARWISAILAAHEASYPVVGGAVEAVRYGSLVDWAAYFCEYGQFMRPLREGIVNEVPGNNISFKRATLQHGQEFVCNGFWKTYWCRALQQGGIALISMPSIVVYCKKSYRLIPFLIRRFHHGRCFAGMRAARASIHARACYLAGSPLLPLLISARITRAVLAKRRYRKEFIRSFPLSVLSVLAWSAGEVWGYAAGQGDSCRHIV